MAPSLAASSLIRAITYGGKLGISRRAYSGAAAQVLRVAEEKASAVKNKNDSVGSRSPSPSSSWVPDPVAGYYRPADKRLNVEEDAELREAPGSQKSSS